jgi:predicted ArsR family transcriptional regulator
VPTTRQEILAHLRTSRSATALELSRHLRVTVADIRYHIAILIQEGTVEVVGQRLTPRRGRPLQVYALTHQAKGDNLAQLASALLYCLRLEKNEAVTRHVARFLVGESLPTSLNLTQRLYRAVQCLSELNYQARWEARAEAPRLILEHCPYIPILDQHPELCSLDIILLEELIRSSLYQTAKLERNPQGIPQCIFIVGKPPVR